MLVFNTNKTSARVLYLDESDIMVQASEIFLNLDSMQRSKVDRMRHRLARHLVQQTAVREHIWRYQPLLPREIRSSLTRQDKAEHQLRRSGKS